MGEKLSFKRVEIPLNKFNNIAIPHHLELLKKHKHNIKMYQKQHEWDRVRIEQNSASRLVKQLKQLLYEMDVLRSQVQESDLEKFDKNTMKSKLIVQDVITDYLVLVSKTPLMEENKYPEDQENNSEINVMPLILDDMKYEHDIVNEKEACLRSAQELHRNLEDLHVAFVQLHQIVTDQGDMVENIEENVETANENVHAGTLELAKAARYKKAMYPLTGAAIGTCIGGPIGFVAGLKLGGLAAIGCGLTGYFGGKMLTECDKNQAVDVTKQNDEQDTSNTVRTKNKIL